MPTSGASITVNMHADAAAMDMENCLDCREAFNFFMIFKDVWMFSCGCKDMFNATAAGNMDTFANLRLLGAFGLQALEGHLRGQLELANRDASINILTGNGDVELSINSAYATLCPFASHEQQACLYFPDGHESPGGCNLNISANGQITLRDPGSKREAGNGEVSEHFVFHNQTLDAVAAVSLGLTSGTSYAVLTSGNPHRTAFLKPPSAVRFVVLPSDSFAGASDMGGEWCLFGEGIGFQVSSNHSAGEKSQGCCLS